MGPAQATREAATASRVFSSHLPLTGPQSASAATLIDTTLPATPRTGTLRRHTIDAPTHSAATLTLRLYLCPLRLHILSDPTLRLSHEGACVGGNSGPRVYRPTLGARGLIYQSTWWMVDRPALTDTPTSWSPSMLAGDRPSPDNTAAKDRTLTHSEHPSPRPVPSPQRRWATRARRCAGRAPITS